MIASAESSKASASADLLRGVAAGTVATGVMTLVMTRVAPAILPPSAQLEEFMPRRVVQRGEELSGDPYALSRCAERRVTTAVHYAYGASAGAVYGLLLPRLVPRGSPLLVGALFGLGVWAVGYAGWLPLAGIRQGTVREPPRRWSNPILSHLVFGLTTALIDRALRRRPASQKRRAVRETRAARRSGTSRVVRRPQPSAGRPVPSA